MKLIDPRGPIHTAPKAAFAPRTRWTQTAGIRVALLENGGGGISVSTRDMGLALESALGCEVQFARKPSRSREAPPELLASLQGAAGAICAVAE